MVAGNVSGRQRVYCCCDANVAVVFYDPFDDVVDAMDAGCRGGASAVCVIVDQFGQVELHGHLLNPAKEVFAALSCQA